MKNTLRSVKTKISRKSLRSTDEIARVEIFGKRKLFLEQRKLFKNSNTRDLREIIFLVKYSSTRFTKNSKVFLVKLLLT